MSQLKLFSGGAEHASFVTSYEILKKTWNVISSSYQDIVTNDDDDDGVGLCWKVYKEQSSDLTIIAFEATKDYSNLQSDLVSSSDLKENKNFHQFEFLCTKKNPSFSLNNTAVSLFCDNLQKLDQLKSKISTPLIVTGKGLGGSIASLFTISLLDNHISSWNFRNRPLCITFGSPLVGDKKLQQAISRGSYWNSCFIHVVSCNDPLPRLFTTNYMPFGTFLFCSDSGSTCFENPDSNLEILITLNKVHGQNQGFDSAEYGNLVEKLRRKTIFKDSSTPTIDKNNSDSLAIGISLQLQQTLGLTPHMLQKQNIDINVLETMIKTLEARFIIQKKISFNPSNKQNEMKGCIAQVEWYKKKTTNLDIGYYDSYKNMYEISDYDVVEFHKKLTSYWEKMVEDVEMKPKKEGAFFPTCWLYGGIIYRRMVEPLAIAQYYKEGGKDYVNKKRSKHFKKLEEQSRNAINELNITRKTNMKMILTRDSCFWAHVEEAILACNELKVVKDKEEVLKKLVEFEDYVYCLLKDYQVSSEIFLSQSSYMSWWKDYKAIKGRSYTSKLDNFMNDAEKVKLYGLGAYEFP
ncbi:putative carboxylesterase [Medicago truncatula]|uniref:Putative carboxylesterase n=1 Tax=Medicago truncatula TaxID=3880 RepID=A0A072U6E8_MEDTR|nr:senescence-associated carboxylesterase 101 [Medicago truncatula]KEH24926.1 senescence-associated protein [Medicago truncatula]RHN49899.1 putative carboxylesterase [Medicago truncatula]